MIQSKRLIFGIICTFIFIVFFVLRSDIRNIGQALVEVNYFFLIPALSCYLIALGWRAIRGKVALRPLGEFQFSVLWKGVIIGYAANNLLPIRLGDLVRSYYLGNYSESSKTSIFATIILERVFDGLGLLFLIGFVSIFLPSADLFKSIGQETRINPLVLTAVFAIPFLASISVLGTAVAFPEGTNRIFRIIVKGFPRRLESKLIQSLKIFLKGFSSLRQPQKITSIFILTLLIWVSESGVFLFLAYGFQLELIFRGWVLFSGILVLTTALANLGTSIPSAGGGIGPFEFFAQSCLMFFGMDVSLASAYILVVHALLLFPVTILGMIYIWMERSIFGELPWMKNLLGNSKKYICH